ncbi:MAG TPA: M20/M25/M40 family metallo-hydrolase [Lacunisphaera sp.]|nr:M20/M25/M40 family metallo-hydrolase [Lacunisphaera sp.]
MRFRPFLSLLCLFATGAALAGLTPGEQKVIDTIDAKSDDFAHDLEQAVQIDSATENLAGVRQVGELFSRQLAELGFESRFVELPASTGRAGHLVAEHRGTKGKRLLLIGHLDTVYPGANFRHEGDKVFGAGVADMKGGDIVLIHALRALYRTGALADTQIIVVMTGDEEAPGSPLEVTRRDLLAAAQRSDVALAFESAIGHTGTVARRGSISWELEVQGATGHSSGIFSAAMGSGSVFEATRILQGFYEQLRQLDGLTFNPALVAAGAEAELTRTGGRVSGKINIIPQRTLVRGDLRAVSAEQLAEAQVRMQAIVKHNLPRTSAVLKFNEGYPAMPPTPANYALLAQLDQASRDLGLGEITAFDPRGRGAGDIAFVSPPLPGLDGLGLGGKGEHTTNESADLTITPELVKRAALLIHRLTR